MKRKYLITIEEYDDGSFVFELKLPEGYTLDGEDISCMLVDVAEAIYEETKASSGESIH